MNEFSIKHVERFNQDHDTFFNFSEIQYHLGLNKSTME